MKNIITKTEHGVINALIVMMIIAIVASTVELGIILIRELIAPPFMLLEIKNMLEVFGFFMMVLIGLELLETIKAYKDDEQIHVEVIFLVALIAVARKIIILDVKALPEYVPFAYGFLLLALAAGYFLTKRSITRQMVKPLTSHES